MRSFKTLIYTQTPDRPPNAAAMLLILIFLEQHAVLTEGVRLKAEADRQGQRAEELLARLDEASGRVEAKDTLPGQGQEPVGLFNLMA